MANKSVLSESVQKPFRGKMDRLIHEVEWYLHRSECEMGVRSCWEAQVAVLCFGVPTQQIDPHTEGRLRACARQNRMRRGFQQLTRLNANIIYAVHGFVRVHPSVSKVFGPRAGGLYAVLANRDMKQLDVLESICKSVGEGKSLSAEEKMKITEWRLITMNCYMKAMNSLKAKLANETDEGGEEQNEES